MKHLWLSVLFLFSLFTLIWACPRSHNLPPPLFLPENMGGAPMFLSPIALPHPEYVQPLQETFTFQKGETLSNLLIRVGFSWEDCEAIAHEIRSLHDLRKFQDGQNIRFAYEPTGSFKTLEFDVSDDTVIALEVSGKNKKHYKASKRKLPLKKGLAKSEGRLTVSLYSAMKKHDVPLKVIHKAVQTLSQVMNLQHDVPRSSRFQVLYEVERNSKGRIAKTGHVLFLLLEGKHKTRRLYYVPFSKGFYDEKGQSLTRNLLRTPVDPRKMVITSYFQKHRRHPIRGYSRAHKGVDFGAPSGTAVMASGDGKVIFSGRKGSFGNLIRIQHNRTYTSCYAHLKKRNVDVGRHVRQGDVIGQVGTTGETTGPHLHYEIWENGVAINPLRLKTLPSNHLEGKALKRFHTYKQRIDALMR